MTSPRGGSLWLALTCFAFAVSCTPKKSSEVKNCAKVRDGEFFILEGGEIVYQIVRKGNKQTERTKDGSVSEWKVEWIDSCQYRLVHIETATDTRKLEPVTV